MLKNDDTPHVPIPVQSPYTGRFVDFEPIMRMQEDRSGYEIDNLWKIIDDSMKIFLTTLDYDALVGFNPDDVRISISNMFWLRDALMELYEYDEIELVNGKPFVQLGKKGKGGKQ